MRWTVYHDWHTVSMFNNETACKTKEQFVTIWFSPDDCLTPSIVEHWYRTPQWDHWHYPRHDRSTLSTDKKCKQTKKFCERDICKWPNVEKLFEAMPDLFSIFHLTVEQSSMNDAVQDDNLIHTAFVTMLISTNILHLPWDGDSHLLRKLQKLEKEGHGYSPL